MKTSQILEKPFLPEIPLLRCPYEKYQDYDLRIFKRKFPKNCKNGICEIAIDETPPMKRYEPKNPDADITGYVDYPNYSLESENADQVKWTHVFETVVKYSPVPGDFFFKDPRAKTCFDKYPNVKDSYDYYEYLGR